MTYAVLEKEIELLPAELQRNIETYAMSVINQYKKTNKKPSVSETLKRITGIISDAPKQTADEIHAERIAARYGI